MPTCLEDLKLKISSEHISFKEAPKRGPPGSVRGFSEMNKLEVIWGRGDQHFARDQIVKRSKSSLSFDDLKEVTKVTIPRSFGAIA